jgi:predicted site-specific integrase-resolvase
MRETLLNETELAEFLGVSIHTLRHWRQAGTGPPWVRYGHHVRYRMTGVERWLDERERQPVVVPARRRRARKVG